jgi:hypothetical protein
MKTIDITNLVIGFLILATFLAVGFFVWPLFTKNTTKLVSPCNKVENTLKEYCMAKESCKGNLKSFVKGAWGDVRFECGE